VVKIRNPKSEGRRKAEIRRQKNTFGRQRRNHKRPAEISLVLISDFGFRVSVFLRPSGFGPRILLPLACLSYPLIALSSDTNGALDSPSSSLRPPRGELLPSFWEQYGAWMILGAVLVLALIALAGWLVMRPKQEVPVPFAVQARIELEPLRQKPEDGALLSQTSQVLRRYIAAMFGLPPGELTTLEFCSAILNDPKIGAELGRETSEFLQVCDLRKFSPAPPSLPPGVVGRALSIIDRGESRLAELNRLAAASSTDSGPPTLPEDPKRLPIGA
jgi:hypothetical protein